MSSNREPIHLLLLTKSENDAESLVSLLRDSGRATRAHLITSLADFVEQLQEKHWDLILAEEEANDIQCLELYKQLKRLNKDVPIVLLAPDAETMVLENHLNKGASAVVPSEERNLLLLIIERELKNLNVRRELRTTQVRLRDAEKRAQALLESSKDAITYISEGIHIFANAAYLDLFGYESMDELEGMPALDMVMPQDQDAFKPLLKLPLQENIGDQKLTAQKSDGSDFAACMSFSEATYTDEECIQIAVRTHGEDVDIEQRIQEISSRDLLTGLYNKPYFATTLEKAVDKAVLKGAKGALFYINIDSFGKVKSDIGINLADNVLSQVAVCLKKTLGERGILARVGEDVYCYSILSVDAETALKIAEKVRAAIESLLVDVNKRTIRITVSVGVALINDNSSNPSELLDQSHRASDQVRLQEGSEKGNGCFLFQPEVKDEVAETNSDDLVSQINNALKNNSFNLLFQPLINLKGDETEHYETLLRLPQDNGEAISAGDFLNSDVIDDATKRKIDRWVILHSTKLLGDHRNDGNNTKLFINLSAASLEDDGLPDWIGVALKAAKTPADSIVLQINEESAGTHLKQAQAFTKALKVKKIEVALTRFGCSLKPFELLKHIHTDYIKVDGSFTQELSQPDALDNLKTMLAQIHELELRSIIPLVENATSVSSLWQLGVHFIQGYYVQAPQQGMSFDFHDDGDDGEEIELV